MEESMWIGAQRRKLGLTQHALARAAGVSQSLVAKIEAGSVDAAYSKVKRIVEALELAASGSEGRARDIMHAGVESVAPGDALHLAASAMGKKAISQLPVVRGGQVVGSLTEEGLLSCFSRGDDIKRMRVEDAMGEPFPSVLPATPVSAVAALLRHHPAVLVSDKGRIAGIITKADILRSI
ncbi:MAG: CBS domain-containing protein [Candidatus Micrarchaeia archaeon]|jgi:predicted transcriptional regulator